MLNRWNVISLKKRLDPITYGKWLPWHTYRNTCYGSQQFKSRTYSIRLRAASHYGRRSRGRRFPPIRLQETKSLASRPFTLRPKSKGRRNLKCLLFEEGDGLSKEVWVGREWKPKLWSRGRRFFFIKKSIIDKILAVRLEGLFWARNKVGCSFGFGLWAWPLEASHYARPKAPITIFYWLFSAHFFGLSTKFGHSIPRPLDLDSHSVKRP